MAQEDRVTTHRKCCPRLHLVLCSPLTPGKRNPVSRSSSLARFHNSVLMEVFASRKEISLYSLCSNKCFQRVLEPSCLVSTGLSLLLWSVRNESSLALPVCRPTWPLSSKPCTSQISSACALSPFFLRSLFSQWLWPLASSQFLQRLPSHALERRPPFRPGAPTFFFLAKPLSCGKPEAKSAW